MMGHQLAVTMKGVMAEQLHNEKGKVKHRKLGFYFWIVNSLIKVPLGSDASGVSLQKHSSYQRDRLIYRHDQSYLISLCYGYYSGFRIRRRYVVRAMSRLSSTERIRCMVYLFLLAAISIHMPFSAALLTLFSLGVIWTSPPVESRLVKFTSVLTLVISPSCMRSTTSR